VALDCVFDRFFFNSRLTLRIFTLKSYFSNLLSFFFKIRHGGTPFPMSDTPYRENLAMDPSPDPADEFPNWLALPRDVTASILMRL
jgi:hypothetical protein